MCRVEVDRPPGGLEAAARGGRRRPLAAGRRGWRSPPPGRSGRNRKLFRAIQQCRRAGRRAACAPSIRLAQRGRLAPAPRCASRATRYARARFRARVGRRSEQRRQRFPCNFLRNEVLPSSNPVFLAPRRLARWAGLCGEASGDARRPRLPSTWPLAPARWPRLGGPGALGLSSARGAT